MRETVAIFGADGRAADWAARFALMGWDVALGSLVGYLDMSLTAARAALPTIYDVALPPEGVVRFCGTVNEALSDAACVVMTGNQDLSVASVQVDPDVPVLVEAATITRVRQDMLVIDALSPVYLLPEVRLTGTRARDRAEAILTQIGMVPIADPPGAISHALASASDDNARVALLRALKMRGEGPGGPLAAHEAWLTPSAPDPDAPAPPVTLDQQVPITWVDYNGHMNETHYLTAFCAATDRMLLWAGMDAACVAAGHSVFTVETHIRHLAEVDIGDRIAVTTRVLEGGGKKLHLWHALRKGDQLCATGEQLLLHVDLSSRRSALPRADVGQWLGRAKAAHGRLPMPEGLGRSVGQRA